MRDLMVIECEEYFGSGDELKCNLILMFSLLDEQLVK